ncbi:MAG: ATP-binding protein [Gammaproteobacteria bacterium]
MEIRLPRTLRGRLLGASSLLLVIFLSVTGAALDHAFRESSQRATRDLLESRVYGLLSAAEVGGPGKVTMRGTLPDEAFSRPGSGLYARFLAADGGIAWASPSLLSAGPDPGRPVAPGEAVFDRVADADGAALARLRFGVAWELGEGGFRSLTVSVSESLEAYFADLARFRREIGAWFLGLGLALLALQAWLLSFVSRPLSQAEREIADMETGRRERLSDGYPEELAALTSRLNALVSAERARAARYRETLDNLAHSLKTPLAVIRSSLSSRHDLPPEVDQAVERMDDIVAYQLSRAASAGPSGLGGHAVAVAPLVRSTAEALDKVHAETARQWDLEVPAGLCFLGQRGDLAEVLGNLMDNAAKWARSRVRVAAEVSPQAATLVVEDDGPGLPARSSDLAERGARGDSKGAGQGIGLAVVRDIVADLGGSLVLGSSGALGGTRVEVVLPPDRVSRRAGPRSQSEGRP